MHDSTRREDAIGFMKRIFSAVLALAGIAIGCSHLPPKQSQPVQQFTLEADRVWLLNHPGNGEFDASALMLAPSGQLFTVNDKEPILYCIKLGPQPGEAHLTPDPDRFSPRQLAELTGYRQKRFDWEGLARDEQNNIYICDEADRWILRFDSTRKKVTQLQFDWSPVSRFLSSDSNASWEGIAVGGGRVYLANERSRGVVCVFDLKTLKLEGSFVVRPAYSKGGDEHYSDLCWFDGRLFVLLRERGCILQVEPSTHIVLAEYDCRPLTETENTAYRFWPFYPTTGLEGLAVSYDFFWLVVDNNGFARKVDARDHRPTLYRCPRPDRDRSTPSNRNTTF